LKEKELTVPGGCVKLYFDPGIIEVRINRTVEYLDWGTGNRLGRVKDEMNLSERFVRSVYESVAQWKNAAVNFAVKNGEANQVVVFKLIYNNAMER